MQYYGQIQCGCLKTLAYLVSCQTKRRKHDAKTSSLRCTLNGTHKTQSLLLLLMILHCHYMPNFIITYMKICIYGYLYIYVSTSEIRKKQLAVSIEWRACARVLLLGSKQQRVLLSPIVHCSAIINSNSDCFFCFICLVLVLSDNELIEYVVRGE